MALVRQRGIDRNSQDTIIVTRFVPLRVEVGLNNSNLFNFSTAEKIEKWVEDVFSDYSLAKGRLLTYPIPIEHLIEDFFGFILTFAEFAEKSNKISGVYIPGNRQIVVNSYDSDTRIRFTSAHELAHAKMLEILFPKKSFTPEEVIRNSVSFTRSEREYFANYTARALLVPRAKLFDVVENIYDLNQYQLKKLASYFNVSLATMILRVEDIKTQATGNFINPTDFTYTGKIHRNETRPETSEKIIVLDLKYQLINSLLLRTVSDYADRPGELVILLREEDLAQLDVLINFPNVKQFLVYSPPHTTDTLLTDEFRSHHSYIHYDATALAEDAGEKDGIKVFLRAKDRHELETVSEPETSLGGIFNSRIKLNSKTECVKVVKLFKKQGKKVVLVTGCFDEIDDRKIRFLSQAKKRGEILVVGVEDDNRVPLFRQEQSYPNIAERIEVLNTFNWINYIFIIRGNKSIPLEQFYTKLYSEISPELLAVSDQDPNLEIRKKEIEAAGSSITILPSSEQMHPALLELKEVIASNPSKVSFLSKAMIENLYLKINGQSKSTT